MQRYESALRPRTMHFHSLIALFILSTAAATAWAQNAGETPYYARVQSFGVFSAYSGDSSHIIMGTAENRRLLEFGVSYSRRLFHNRIVNWQYNGELLPVVLESDPLSLIITNQVTPTVGTASETSDPPITCAATTTSYSWLLGNGKTYSGTYTDSCSGRKWAIGEGISPVGFQWNFRPRHKAQPFLIGHGGYMYSTQPIPTAYAGSFNFTFDFGAGIELYRTKTRSIRAEYRIHHISNHNTSNENPGIDNGLFQLTYSFGR